MPRLPKLPGSKPRTEPPAQSIDFRAIAGFLVVAVCTAAFVMTAMGICAGLLSKHAAGTRDFVEYWASGIQLRHHADPYDRGAIGPMERSLGFPQNTAALIMPNPPTAFPLVFPLGFLSPRTAELLWSLLLLASLVASVSIVRALHGTPRNHLHLLGYGFAPALMGLATGQVAILVLLGLVFFLRLHRSNPFLAGASLWLCALKPQLFLPFGLVLLAWIVTTRRYKVLAGAVSALVFSAAAAIAIDPAAWTQYRRMMSSARLDKLPIPCLSNWLRRSVSPDSMWLQYLPAAIGCAWALAYFWRHRHDWSWVSHGSLLTLVSVLVAPYSWLFDQAILLPALLHAVFLTRSRSLLAMLALTSAVLEVAPLRGMPLLQLSAYLWTAPAWLLWYVFATRYPSPGPASSPPWILEGVHPAAESAQM